MHVIALGDILPPSQGLESTYKTTRHHKPEEHNLKAQPVD
jgi:hypothetical protein